MRGSEGDAGGEGNADGGRLCTARQTDNVAGLCTVRQTDNVVGLCPCPRRSCGSFGGHRPQTPSFGLPARFPAPRPNCLRTEAAHWRANGCTPICGRSPPCNARQVTRRTETTLSSETIQPTATSPLPAGRGSAVPLLRWTTLRRGLRPPPGPYRRSAGTLRQDDVVASPFPVVSRPTPLLCAPAASRCCLPGLARSDSGTRCGL